MQKATSKFNYYPKSQLNKSRRYSKQIGQSGTYSGQSSQDTIWQVTQRLVNDGNNSQLWQSELLKEHIKSVELLKFAAKCLRETLPVHYLEHVRVMLSKDNNSWILVGKEAILTTKLNMLADSLEEKIAAKFNYNTQIKVVINPDRWLFCGIALVDAIIEKDDIPDIATADDIIANFIKSNNK